MIVFVNLWVDYFYMGRFRGGGKTGFPDPVHVNPYKSTGEIAQSIFLNSAVNRNHLNKCV